MTATDLRQLAALLVAAADKMEPKKPKASHADKRRLASDHLKKGGWSYRRVAPKLGVHWMHLYKVLNGQRDSRRLINAILSLPAASR